jgi:protein-tyrosine-phosphatase/predicted ATP-grasp superfamily ATP-dependent carboligase
MQNPTDRPARQRVLVLDADQGSALAVVRSLGRRGLEVDVASATAAPIAAYSRHAAQVLRYPDPLQHEQGFVDWLATQLQRDPYAMVVPVTERSLVPLVRLYHGPGRDRIAMAPAQALEQVLDKERTMALAASLGVAIPRSREVGSLADAHQAMAGLGWPVVVKPARSVGVRAGQRVQLSVAYAFDERSLDAAVHDALRYGSVLLQEYFRGDGVGVELIADRGVVRYAFQHRRLHEVPLTGGGSSLRISEAVHPALLAASRQLMQALGWHGVAMVEFKLARATGEFRLMEINGRFWGSLPLAVAAGADFPAMLHELMTTGAVAEHTPARPGVLCRQLARDVDWLEHVLRKAAPPGLVTLPPWQQVLRDTLQVFLPRHHFDIQSLRDPRPGLVDLRRLLSHQWKRSATLWQRRRFLARQCRAAQAHGVAVQQLGAARQVLFLCHGNINRSAVAQVYAQSRYGSRFTFKSAGFHEAEGRPADPEMVAQASRQGLDLSAWQSRSLSPALLAGVDLVYVMEQAHLERLLASTPGLAGRVFLLGAAAAGAPGQAEIPDPYGRASAHYAQTLLQVTRSVDAWMQRVGVAPQPGHA